MTYAQPLSPARAPPGPPTPATNTGADHADAVAPGQASGPIFDHHRLQRPQALADLHPAPPRPRQSHHRAARPARPHPPAHHPLTDDHDLRPATLTSPSTARPAHTSPLTSQFRLEQSQWRLATGFPTTLTQTTLLRQIDFHAVQLLPPS